MLDKFAKLLGIRPDQAEDALHSERAAKHVVSRRSFLGVGAALAGGALFSFPTPESIVLTSGDYAATVEIGDRIITASRGSSLITFDALLKRHYLNGIATSMRDDPLLAFLERPKARPLT